MRMYKDEMEKFKWDHENPGPYLANKTHDIFMKKTYLNEDIKNHLADHLRFLERSGFNNFVELKRNTEPAFISMCFHKVERQVAEGKAKRIQNIPYKMVNISTPWFNAYDTMAKLSQKYFKGDSYNKDHKMYTDLWGPDFGIDFSRGKKEWNTPSDNPLYKWTDDWEYGIHPANHADLRSFMKARIKKRKKYSKALVEAKIKEKERIEKEKADAVAFQLAEEKRETLLQKYTNAYEDLNEKRGECYVLVEKKRVFTTRKNKANALYAGQTQNYDSRRKKYKDFKDPGNEFVNKLVKKFPKQTREQIINKLKNNVKVKRLKFTNFQDEDYRKHIEGYLIQRLKPLLNTAKTKSLSYKDRSFIVWKKQ